MSAGEKAPSWKTNLVLFYSHCFIVSMWFMCIVIKVFKSIVKHAYNDRVPGKGDLASL